MQRHQVVVSLLVTVFTSTLSTEVSVPERYLRPRNYNPHPLQTLLSAASPLGLLLDQHPYQYFTRPAASGRQSDSSPVQFPAVPEAAKPTKSHTPGYITVPKNYAFSYAVKDRASGDDFSHQQAQTGEATRGEYRVKLPDGRTQIVSYTADSSGYKADVRYDGQANEYTPKYTANPVKVKPQLSVDYPLLNTNSLLQDVDYNEEPEVVYKQPVRIVYKQNTHAQQYTKAGHTPRPLGVLFSPTPQPYKTLVPAPSPVQYRALPQTAEEYTSSDAPLYAATPTPGSGSGYYAPPVSSTATPIQEDQEDVSSPRKQTHLPPSSYYSVSSTASPPVSYSPSYRYFLVPHNAQYVYTDS